MLFSFEATAMLINAAALGANAAAIRGVNKEEGSKHNPSGDLMNAPANNELAFNQPLASWDMSSIRSISHMFDGAASFSQNLCPWYSKITYTDTTPVIGHVFDGTACLGSEDPDFATQHSFCLACPSITSTIPPTVAPTGAKTSTPSPAPFYYYPTPAPTTTAVSCNGELIENLCCQGESNGNKTPQAKIIQEDTAGTKGCIFSTNDDLKNAIKIYNTDKQKGIDTFGVIDCWDVSSVTNLNNLFNGFKTFNEKISCWDVSDVYSMNSKFQGALAFNQPLADWDVSNVLDMTEMFLWARSFNQPLASWNISNAKEMNSMFDGALVFNQNLCPWFDKSDPLTGLTISCLHASEPDFKSKSHFCTDCT